MKIASKLERLIDAGAVVVWRPIPEYEGYFEASNEGDVRSMPRKGQRKLHLLKPVKKRSGYLQVLLCKDGKRKYYLVHQLVVQAFVGECPDGFQVNHKNEIKTDNRLDNLEYVTPRQNCNHGTRNARMGRARGISVECYDLKTGETVKRYPSEGAAERDGYDQGKISKCINGHHKSHAGLGWRRSTTT